MSLLLHYNFNENDNAVVYDYSTNGKHATGINNFTVVAGELGYAGRFNGTNTDLIFGDVGNVGGTDQLSVFCKFNKDANKRQYLAYKAGHFRLYFDNSGKIIFEVYIGGGWFGITSGDALASSAWHNVLGVYDGSDIYIYIEGIEDDKFNKSGNIDASANDFIIGSDTANYFDGDIELVEVWDTALSSDEALAHSSNPIGIKYDTFTDHSLALGDLISISAYDSPIQMVVSFVDDTDTFRAIPISGKINFKDTPVRRGNIYQTSRQWVSEFRVLSGQPIFQIIDELDNFDKYSTNTPNIKITKDGIYLGGLTPGQVVFPDADGLLTGDSNLFWDEGNSRLGIGTPVPVRTLEVKRDGSSTTGLRVTGVQGAGRDIRFEFANAGTVIGDFGQNNIAGNNATFIRNLVNGARIGFVTTTAGGVAAENLVILGSGIVRIYNKLVFTQLDGNEFIDSLNDGYMDYGATTEHRFNRNTRINGNLEVTGTGHNFFSDYVANEHIDWTAGVDETLHIKTLLATADQVILERERNSTLPVGIRIKRSRVGGADSEIADNILEIIGVKTKAAAGGAKDVAAIKFEGTGVAIDEAEISFWTRRTNQAIAKRLVIDRDGNVETVKNKITNIGGIAILITNKTGVNTVQGQLVKADPANNDSVILTAADDTECIGVFLDNGIADGSEAWVVVAGIADVAMGDNEAATRGNWVETNSAEAGYADATAATPPAAPAHFHEIGHCIETVAAGGGGTHILSRCVLHFN